MLLRSIDIFSGIGGLTLALEGIVKPVVYCDISPACRTVLAKHMRDGTMPRAPIHDDVRTLNGKAYGPVDIVVGGFPCVGFSHLGKQEGFREAQSSMFFEMVRIVGEAKPSFVFMENVAAILKKGMKTVISVYDKMGYDIFWGIFPAYAVGAPQSRKRWYCLATKRTVLTWPGTFRKSYVCKGSWKREIVPRLKPKTHRHTVRSHMMGNAVVPDCARLAFNYLFSGGRVRDLTSPVSFARPELGAVVRGEYPIFGSCSKKICHILKDNPPSWTKPHYNIEIDPSLYKGTPINTISREKITKKFKIPMWTTPRCNGNGGSHVLTERTRMDLCSQVRFATSTKQERIHPMNPEWLEWLQGYPVGWTSH
jgi:hypothetical protein